MGTCGLCGQAISAPDWLADNYGFDSAEQKTETYTGMGHDINVHDQWAAESMGPIQDRTAEHLGASDIAITAYRKRLLAAISGDPVMQDDEAPIAMDTVAPAASWQAAWQDADAARRKNSKWVGMAS